jgi:hypothetical protein
MRGAIPPLPNTPSWRGAQFVERLTKLFWTTYIRKRRSYLQDLPHILHDANWVIRGCIQKFPDWPPGVRTANGTALCH